MRSRTTVFTVAAVLLLTACSRNGEADTTITAPTTTTTSVAPPTTQTTSPPPPTSTTIFTPATLAPDAEGVVPAGASLTQASKISTVGMGPVRVGMTVPEAEAAAGMRLVGELDPAISPDCYFVEPEAGIPGVAFMVHEGRISRVDVYASGTVTTLSGAHIGMTESQILALFPERIEDRLDYRVDGRALVFVPVDEADRNFRVVFEVDDGIVSGMRGGILPSVQFGEGCS
jgi:hypothetical protein